MKCRKIPSLPLRPDDSGWSQAETQKIDLIAAPLAMQPTAYIAKSWKDKPYGRITTLDVATLHDGATFAIRISWQVPPARNNDFPPAIAFALPVKAAAPLTLMGTKDAPIHVLRWQGGKHNAGVRSVVAHGIGSSNHGPDAGQKATAIQDGDKFSVVFTRALGSGAGVAPLKPGSKTQIGFAAWDGGNEERAGIKSFSVDWTDLELDA